MRFFAVLFAAVACARGSAPGGNRARPIALRDVQIVDLERGQVMESRTIVVRGNRIEQIVPADAALPADAVVVDGHGSWALPGLWDAHVHISDASLADDQAQVAPAFVANGVTSVRDMGGDLQQIDAVRAAIAEGEIEGPRIRRAGPILDGPKEGAPFRLSVASPDEARAAVRMLAGKQVDFVKIHNGISREAFFAAAAEARALRLPFAVHLPHSVTAREAVLAGAATLEHTETLLESGLQETGLAGATFEEADAALVHIEARGEGSLIDSMLAKETCFTPTLTEYRSFAGLPTPAGHPAAPPSLVAFWDKFSPLEGAEKAAAHELRQRAFARFLQTVARFAEAGVPILAGTDLGARDVYPGWSLHEELRLLSKAGLGNLQVLRAATVAPARCFGVVGANEGLAPDSPADILLLDSNPLADLGALDRIRLVLANGKVVRR